MVWSLVDNMAPILVVCLTNYLTATTMSLVPTLTAQERRGHQLVNAHVSQVSGIIFLMTTLLPKTHTGYDTAFEKDKHFGEHSYSVSSRVEEIQTEIMTNGPVEGAFRVYGDFPTYRSGTL